MFKNIIMLLIIIACVGNFSYAFLRDVDANCKCWYGTSTGSSSGGSGCQCNLEGNGCTCFELEDPES